MISNARWAALAVLLIAGGCARETQHGTGSELAVSAYEAGLEEMRRFRMPEAVEQFHAAIEADSTFAMAYLELARCYSWVGRAGEVDSAFEHAYSLRHGAEVAERLQIEHSYAASQRRIAEVDSVYRILESEFPDDAYTLAVIARRKWRDMDFEGAAASYRRILEQDASRVDVHNLLGYLYLEAGDYDDSIQSFQRYVFYAPDLANPHDSLGDAYAATGRYEDAATQYWAALEIDPTFFHSWGQLAGVLIETGQLQQAHSILEKTADLFEELEQTHWRSLLQLRILLASHDWEALAERVPQVLEQEAMKTDVASNYALNASAMHVIALLEMGKVDAARTARIDFEKRLMASVKAESGADPKELPDFVRLAQASLDSRFARAMGEPATAIDGLVTALAQSKQSPHQLSQYRIELSRARLQAGQAEAALEELAVLLDAIPTQPEANLLAAEAFAQIGRSEDVLRHLGIYLEVMRRADPEHPEVREAQLLAERYAIAN